MNPASIVAGVLAFISISLLVVSIRRGPPYTGTALDRIAAGLMALCLVAMWLLRGRVDLIWLPFGTFTFVLGYYLGTRAATSLSVPWRRKAA